MSPTRPAPDILETEWDLLEALWNAESATAREVMRAVARRRGWAYSTVRTLLGRMVEKGLVHARHVGPVLVYSAAMPREKARRWVWRRFVDMAFGGSAAPALSFVARESKLSKQERAQLRAEIAGAQENDDE